LPAVVLSKAKNLIRFSYRSYKILRFAQNDKSVIVHHADVLKQKIPPCRQDLKY